MRSIFLLILMFGTGISAEAQVGINTTDPRARLDIAVGNPASPSVLDGILIPRVSDFSASQPSADQHGMLVFLTTEKEGFPVGFYFWNHERLQWEGLSGSALSNFLLSGSVTPSGGATEAIYREGNVGIGADTEGVKLRVVIDAEEEVSTRTGVEVVNQSTAESNVTYSLLMSNSSLTAGRKYGIKNFVSSDGRGEHYGIYNETYQSASGPVYGIFNKVGRTIGAQAPHYGIFTEIGTPTGTGFAYGIYSKATAADSTKAFAGYFAGRVGIGAAPEVEYVFPDSRGVENQVLMLGEAGQVKWGNLGNSAIMSTGNMSGNFEVPEGVGTLQIEDGVSGIGIPDPASNAGRILVLLAAQGVAFKNFVPEGGAGVRDVLKDSEITGIRGGERYIIQSTGSQWIVIGQ